MRKWLLMVAVALVAGMLTGCGEKGKEVKAVSDIDLVKNYVFPWDKSRTFETMINTHYKSDIDSGELAVSWEEEQEQASGRKFVHCKVSLTRGDSTGHYARYSVLVNLDKTCELISLSLFDSYNVRKIHLGWNSEKVCWADRSPGSGFDR